MSFSLSAGVFRPHPGGHRSARHTAASLANVGCRFPRLCPLAGQNERTRAFRITTHRTAHSPTHPAVPARAAVVARQPRLASAAVARGPRPAHAGTGTAAPLSHGLDAQDGTHRQHAPVASAASVSAALPRSTSRCSAISRTAVWGAADAGAAAPLSADTYTAHT
jgi:hypothetical protein